MSPGGGHEHVANVLARGRVLQQRQPQVPALGGQARARCQLGSEGAFLATTWQLNLTFFEEA